MTPQQPLLFLQQLQQHHPAAFKRNFLLYGAIKIKGMLDKWKEILPWVLALLIFIPLSMVLADVIQQHLPQFDAAQSKSMAILALMLLLMLTTPYVIYQLKHSAAALYRMLRHTPIKLAIVILMQALNVYYWQSVLLQGILFFFALSFGFVRFYKENLFRHEATPEQQYCLQQIRRAAYWSHRQLRNTHFKMYFYPKSSARYADLAVQRMKYANLHQQIMQVEHKFAQQIKFIDLDSYLNEISQ